MNTTFVIELGATLAAFFLVIPVIERTADIHLVIQIWVFHIFPKMSEVSCDSRKTTDNFLLPKIKPLLSSDIKILENLCLPL